MASYKMENFFLPSHPSNSAWPLIKRLLSSIIVPVDLKALTQVINKYQTHNLNFTNLFAAYQQVSSSFQQKLSNKIFPSMIRLVLEDNCKKEYIPLKKIHIGQENKKIIQEVYTAKDAAVFLAHSFFCTFPSRPRDYNTVSLMGLFNQPQNDVKINFIKCFFTYFSKVADGDYRPERTLTMNRVMVNPQTKQHWAGTQCPILGLDFRPYGSIDDAKEMLQVDFANQQVGSSTLNGGALQEQIRFIAYPEMNVAMINCERLTNSEAIIITGYEQFCTYSGYGHTFKFTGEYCDPTAVDNCGNRLSQMVAIDALAFSSSDNQFSESNLLRELNKAYSGFFNYFNSPYGVSTGNWGCGAFNGNVQLKSLIQLMACSKSNREMAYYSFNNSDAAGLPDFHRFLLNRRVTVGQLFSAILNCSHQGNLFDSLKSKL